MLGIGAPGSHCDQNNVVLVIWELWSGGKEVANGTSSDYDGGGVIGGEMVRTLGRINGEAGGRCYLVLNFLDDARVVAAGGARVTVDVIGGYYEDRMISDAIIVLLCIGLCGGGVGCLIVAMVRHVVR